MRAVQIEVYTLDELTPEARAVAFANYSDSLDYDQLLADDMQYLLEDTLEEAGATELYVKPRYSLSYSKATARASRVHSSTPTSGLWW